MRAERRAGGRVRLTGAEAPPIAEDPQPDGALELPDIDDDLLEIFVQEGARYSRSLPIR